MTKIISIVGGMQPTAPTIGTATAGDTTASVAFTASSYIGKGTITYTATSSPGGFTATGASSPLTVTGLTNGTAYTFTVVGTTNYGVASVASAASNSVTPALSSFLAYDSIASYVVTSPVSSVTFNSIPQTYKHLQIRGVHKWSTSASPDWSNMVIRFNNDTTSNYSYASLIGGQSGTITGGGSTGFDRGYLQTFAPNSASAFTNVFGCTIVDILDYTDSVRNKGGIGAGGYSGNTYGYSQVGGHFYLQKTDPVTRIDIFLDNNNITQYSSYCLYGIKG